MLAKQIMIISLIIPFAEYYTIVAIRRTIRNVKYRRRAFIWILYAILSVSLFWGMFSFREWSTTSWPSNFIKILVNFFIGVFIGKVVIAMLMFAGDILLVLKGMITLISGRIKAVKKPSGTSYTITRSEFISKSALLCGAALTAGLGYGMTNRYRYKLRHMPMSLIGMPEALRGLRIAQISDIHAGSFDNADAISRGVIMIMNEKPDLILFTGDLVNFRADEIRPYMDIFNKLRAPLGVYSVLGNHDYGDYISWPSEEARLNDFELLQGYHQSLGWQLLKNEHVILNWKGVPFALIGVENWSAKARFPKYGNLEKAVAGLENSELSLKILMSHDPSHWDAEILPGHPDISLTLSGHTHGMQLGIEIPGIKWSPAQYIYEEWAGLYRKNEQYLYVNRGYGFIGYNGRLGILPEVTLLELT
jgi:hypothetical protein